MKTDQLLNLDRHHIWHPYTSIPAHTPVYPVASADGVFLTLKDGRQLIDGMSSWWAAIHGYNHPRLNAAAHRQIDTMSHVMFGGLTHEPAVQLAERLLDITPESLDLVFFSDSGSVSVEVALKMAIQYWQALGNPDKNRFIALSGGYHGDTFGAMSVCDPDNGMHHMFNRIVPKHYFAPRPESRFDGDWNPADSRSIEAILSKHGDNIAAVIIEPIVQGAGGMWFYHSQYLLEIRRLCNQFDVLLIADEIATGFARTGSLFACEQAGISPDILCLGKALTGGYLSLAATLTREDIGTTISGSEAGCFMHGPTFMANPLACSIAGASIDLLLESNWRHDIAMIEKLLTEGLTPCAELPAVADVRVLGAIGVIELESPVNMALVQKKLVDHGIWLRPFGRLLYTMPPYICSPEHINQITSAMYSVLSEQQ